MTYTKETVYTLKPVADGPTIKVTDGPGATVEISAITGINCSDTIAIPFQQINDLIEVLSNYRGI